MTTSPAEAFTLDERTYGYFRRIARSQKIPEALIEDATQEMALAAWQARDHWAIAAQRQATDFLRRHVVKRNGRSLATSELPETIAAPTADSFLDEKRALNALTPRERTLIERTLAGDQLTNNEQQALSSARELLRRVLAGELCAPDKPMRRRLHCSCGVIFWTDNIRRRRCHPRCTAKYRMRELRRSRRPPVARCDYCSAKLTYRHGSRRRSKRHCGSLCRQRAATGRRPTDYDRACVWCRAPFRAKVITNVYCSQRCVRDAWRARQRSRLESRRCAECGDQFEPHDPRNRFCATPCRVRFHSRARRRPLPLAAAA